MDEHKKKKIRTEDIVIWAGVVLGAILLITNFMAFSLGSDLRKATEEYQEATRPGRIELHTIVNSRCQDCFDISPVVSAIKAAKVNITDENTIEFNSNEAKDLIAKYQLKKIPAVIITGEIDRVAIDGLAKQDDALIYSEISPPYTNAGTGRVEGLAKLSIIKDSACKECSDLSALIFQIKGAGIKFSEEKTIESSSPEGAAIISKYGLTSVPSAILSKDAGVYEQLKQAWPQIGTVEKDGSYVLRTAYPPFRNLTTGEVRGVVKIIYLTDSSCAECYDTAAHKAVLSSPGSFGINFASEETVDVSSARGKELVSKYSITKVPTVILSDGVSVYPSSQGLKSFFKVDKDGSYIFTSLDLMGSYKDLSTGQVVAPSQEQ